MFRYSFVSRYLPQLCSDKDGLPIAVSPSFTQPDGDCFFHGLQENLRFNHEHLGTTLKIWFICVLSVKRGKGMESK